METEKILKNDSEWLSENMAKLQESYEGKWIAIVNKKIIAFGKNFGEAFDMAKRKFPNISPLIDYVPKKEALVI